MKILYISSVGPFGGSSRSLYEAVRVLSQREIEPYFVTAEGTALDFYGLVAKHMITTRGLTRFDNTQYSHYRGIRWLILLREVFHFPYTLMALYRAKRRWGDFSIIHVNEITEIISGLIAKLLFKAPLIVHVRSPQWNSPNSWRSKWIYSQLRDIADAVIAIDETTRATLPSDIPVDVIQNSFTAKRSDQPDMHLARRLGALRPLALKVGFVGNLQISKGIFELLEAAKIIRNSGRDVEFVIVGGYTRMDRGVKAWVLQRAGLAQNLHFELTAKIEKYGLADCVHLLGATNDIQSVYERLDVICFPSHFDAPGRPVFEAAFSAVPCIACVSDPKADTLVHGQTGLTIPARDPVALSEAIIHFADDRSEVSRMGKNAQELAITNFDPQKNADKVRALYMRVIAKTSMLGSRAVIADMDSSGQ